MFDKLYKEANDEIAVNIELMEKLKYEASRAKKRGPYGFIYKYGYLAAAVLIVAVSLNVLPVLKDAGEIEKPYGNDKISIESEENSDVQYALLDKIQEPEEDSNPKEKSSKQNVKEAPLSDTLQKNTATARKEAVLENESSAGEVGAMAKSNDFDLDKNAYNENEAADVIAFDASNLDKEENHIADSESHREITDSPVRFSGGGGSSEDASQDAALSEIIEFSEYCEYFGVDVSGMAIPRELDLISGREVTVDKNANTGEYVAKNHLIQYQGQNKTLSIEICAANPEKANTAEGEMYKDNAWIIPAGKENLTAYIKKETMGIIIHSYGIEKKDIYKLIDSIK